MIIVKIEIGHVWVWCGSVYHFHVVVYFICFARIVILCKTQLIRLWEEWVLYARIYIFFVSYLFWLNFEFTCFSFIVFRFSRPIYCWFWFQSSHILLKCKLFSNANIFNETQCKLLLIQFQCNSPLFLLQFSSTVKFQLINVIICSSYEQNKKFILYIEHWQ